MRKIAPVHGHPINILAGSFVQSVRLKHGGTLFELQAARYDILSNGCHSSCSWMHLIRYSLTLRLPKPFLRIRTSILRSDSPKLSLAFPFPSNSFVYSCRSSHMPPSLHLREDIHRLNIPKTFLNPHFFITCVAKASRIERISCIRKAFQIVTYVSFGHINAIPEILTLTLFP